MLDIAETLEEELLTMEGWNGSYADDYEDWDPNSNVEEKVTYIKDMIGNHHIYQEPDGDKLAQMADPLLDELLELTETARKHKQLLDDE